jgi:hypothetical protein
MQIFEYVMLTRPLVINDYFVKTMAIKNVQKKYI